MGKITLLILYEDITFEEKKVETEANTFQLSDNWNPSFTRGLSIFREREQKIFGRYRKPFQKPRQLGLIMDKAPEAFKLEAPERKVERKRGRPKKDGFSVMNIIPTYWTYAEIEKFVKKVVLKSSAKLQSMTNWQFVILAGLLIFCIVAIFLFNYKGNIRFG